MSGSNGRGMSGSNGRGMSGSNGRGMSGSTGRGMSGSNGRGMSGSNGRGMSGSNGRGMSGSNGRGMSGSNGRGMSGSNGRGMSGSNGRGMSGSNGRGMSGSNGRGMSGSNGRAVSGSAFAASYEAAAMGPVDAVLRNGSVATLVVAGQSFAVSPEDASAFSVGDYVVAGAIEADTAALVYHVGVPYVPGVSPVRLKTTVDSVDTATARLTAGGLTIDYSQQLSLEPDFSPAEGETIEVVGVQPSPLGLLVASRAAEGAGGAIANRR
jgi:hypothetical protein